MVLKMAPYMAPADDDVVIDAQHQSRGCSLDTGLLSERLALVRGKVDQPQPLCHVLAQAHGRAAVIDDYDLLGGVVFEQTVYALAQTICPSARCCHDCRDLHRRHGGVLVCRRRAKRGHMASSAWSSCINPVHRCHESLSMLPPDTTHNAVPEESGFLSAAASAAAPAPSARIPASFQRIRIA